SAAAAQGVADFALTRPAETGPTRIALPETKTAGMHPHAGRLSSSKPVRRSLDRDLRQVRVVDDGEVARVPGHRDRRDRLAEEAGRELAGRELERRLARTVQRERSGADERRE